MAPALRVAVLLATLLFVVGCGPEAERSRGQPGADIGNRDPASAMEIHGDTNPSYDTPLKGMAIEVIEK